MQYSVLIIFSLLIALAGIGVSFYLKKLKNSLFEKIIRKKIINKPDFSTPVVRQFGGWILKLSQQERDKILHAVAKNNADKVIAQIKPAKLQSKIAFIWKGKPFQKQLMDKESRLLEIRRLINKQQFDKAEKSLRELRLSSRDKGLKAQENIAKALIALKEGDMSTATQMASESLRYFQKKNWAYEEGEAYFVLGTAYRVSGVFDAADFMLRSADQIFKSCGAVVKEAEVKGTQGLLMAVQKRFDEAEEYYNQAEKILKEHQFREDLNFIISQKALLEILRGRAKQAVVLAQKAFDGHKTTKGKAFAADILARAFYHLERFKKAEHFVKEAERGYLKEKNEAAAFECAYLTAEIYIKRGWSHKAESRLRELIKTEVSCKTCFHIANAYTLLGLLLLERGAFAQAESLFNKALQQEFYNNRYEGIAIDYANLAAVERKCGREQEAQKNKETALLYAKKAGKELYEQFKAVLK